MAPISHQSIYYKYGWDRINVATQKKSSLEQISSLHNQIHDITNPKYLKKEMEKNLKFPQEWIKDETRHIVQLIHLIRGGVGILNMHT